MPVAETMIPIRGWEWLPFSFCVLIAIYAVAFGPRALKMIWSGEHRWVREPMPAYWPWGPVLWRACVRSTPSMTVAFYAGWGAFFLGVVGEQGSALAPVVYVLLGLFSLIMFILVPVVALFARPRSVIPPPLRDQPGAIREWLGEPKRDPRSL